MTTARISLDSPVFNGRLRNFARRSNYERREVRATRQHLVSDIRPSAPVVAQKQKQVPAAKIARHHQAASVQPRTDRSLVLRRETVRAPSALSNTSTTKTSSNIHKKLLTALAVVLFVAGIGVAVDGFMTNRHVEAQVEQQSTGGSSDSGAPMVGDVPNEGDKPDVNAYQVAAALPRKITIPKLSVEARTLKLGTTASGAVAAPSSIYDTGWYQDSAKPGESGAMLVDGHVHGPTKPGVFYELKTLKAGDEILVERGDGKTFTYKVIKTKTYPADSVDMMGAALTPVTAGKPGLNLITCTGELDGTNHYKDRLVVFAEQL
jgi:LPXTG-site transpeptidase (sortase) family protein